MVKEGKPIRGIQKQLGHTSLNTTQIYLDYFDDDRKNDFGDNENDMLKKIAELSKELEELRGFIKM